MRRNAACIDFILRRKVELDLLCVAGKELATRGLGVPVDKKKGRESDYRHSGLFSIALSVVYSINSSFII